MLGPVFIFLGGLGLFMYGVHTTSDGLQKFAANRLKQILNSLTEKTFLAVLLGMVVTVALQSSAATTVLVVEFVNAGMMSLAQALGIVLGSAVGTSIVIQLIAFKMLNIALGAIFLGFILHVFGRGQWKHLGQSLIGFGIIFVGMANMSEASAPLKNIPEVYTFLTQIGAQPLLALLVGLLLTTVIQSSTALFAIMMSLAGQQLLHLNVMVPLVLGAHIGGTMTTLLSSFTAQQRDARRAALANTGYKVVAAIVVFPFLSEFAQLITWTTRDLQRQVANAHLLFALFMVFIFLPFNTWIAKALKWGIPDNPDQNLNPKFKVLDKSSLEVPTVALNQVEVEIIALGDLILEKMMQEVPAVVLELDEERAVEFAATEEKVAWYYRHITRFLTALSHKGLTEEQAEECLNAQFILKEMDYIEDIFISIRQLIQKLHRDKITLPFEDWEQLQELHNSITKNFARMIQALHKWDVDLAAEVIREHPEIMRLQRSLQFSALAQTPHCDLDEDNCLNQEKLCYAVVDLINLLYTIDDHVVNIAQVVMGIV
ncbi:Na/Pi cotransporter family protein [Desulfosporosinus sp. BG]|uniref:Na/Pi cotransporter family protein n=1 Tax=Desulfosporosinus sp. BG TaxID=1633135 RepID=UPI00083B49AD|nr:Na/Pi cotransporter family protein [Desulfosporosinus sp. BG]ODA41097.1 Sodium-dependent phosphate transporter [Desulfosporosinus sp. BG]